MASYHPTLPSYRPTLPSDQLASQAALLRSIAVTYGCRLEHLRWQARDTYGGRLEHLRLQAAPLRSIAADAVIFSDGRGWSSGGFAADLRVTGAIDYGTQQQASLRSSNTYGCRLEHPRLQARTRTVAGSSTHGCRLERLRLQAFLRSSNTYGCRPEHLRLQAFLRSSELGGGVSSYPSYSAVMLGCDPTPARRGQGSG